MYIEQILQRIGSGATVVTATKRLAREVQLAHALAQRKEGRAAWPTPEVLPWGAWLQSLWDRLWWREERHPLLLHPAQESCLWEACIEAVRPATIGARLGATARDAQAAWGLCRGWRIDLEEIRRVSTAESRVFYAAAREYLRRCDKGGWTDFARLPDLLSPHPWDPDGGPVLLAGFDRLTPQQSDLLDRLREAGVDAGEFQWADRETKVRGVAFPSADAELSHAAQWAREILAGEPDARIGMVIPDLEARRDAVERIFDDVFRPGGIAPGRAPGSNPVHISLGKSTDRYPAVGLALRLLTLLTGRVHHQDFGLILRSPFLGDGLSRAPGRARQDQTLREALHRRGTPEAGLTELIHLAREADDTPLSTALSRVREWHRSGLTARKPSDWVSLFGEMLDAFGWPGERTPESAEHQLVAHWRVLLSEFALLDAVLARVTLEEALARLGRMTAQSIFQPETTADRVDILGIIEAGGLEFDHLWLAGMHEENWPAQPRSNALIPVSLQRRHGLPGSSSGADLENARRVTKRLMSSASDVVVSWPRQLDDRSIHVSPLFRDVPSVEPGSLVDTPPVGYASLVRLEGTGPEIQSWDPPPALPVPQAMAGGAALLTHQSACPFRAFAEHRLRATTLERPAPGLHPMIRGIIVHAAMESLWRELRDQAGLEALGSAERDSLIGRVVAKAIARHAGDVREPRLRRQLELERHRLGDQIRRLLALDQQRAPFRVVAYEELESLDLDGLSLRIKLDRVDELEDGSGVVLDYKTGQADEGTWFSDRPGEPQLPLYAITRPRPPGVVAFVSLTAARIGYHGVARETTLLGEAADLKLRVPPAKQYRDWEDLLRTWREKLTGLANEFIRGEAFVNPTRSACRYCHLATLCRVDEGRSELEAEA